MGLFKLKPARDQALDDARLISDLDKIVCEPVAFRFLGKSHLIKPIKTKEFLVSNQALARLDLLRKKNQISNEDLIQAYTDLFSSMCDTIGRKEVEQMTQAQVGALFQLIMDCITGKAYVDPAEKKNTRMTQEPA